MTVYFVQAGPLDGPVKIGWSRNGMRHRIELIQTYNAEKLSLIREEEGDREIETFFHRELRHLWIRGEWYRFDKSILTLPVPQVTDMRAPVPNDRMSCDELRDNLVFLNISQTEFARQIGYTQFGYISMGNWG